MMRLWYGPGFPPEGGQASCCDSNSFRQPWFPVDGRIPTGSHAYQSPKEEAVERGFVNTSLVKLSLFGSPVAAVAEQVCMGLKIVSQLAGRGLSGKQLLASHGASGRLKVFHGKAAVGLRIG